MKAATDVMCLSDALELMFIGIALLLVPIIVFLYARINKQRDYAQQDAHEKGVRYSPEDLKRLGDRAPDFRYML